MPRRKARYESNHAQHTGGARIGGGRLDQRGVAHEPGKAPDPKNDQTPACIDMMQGSGVTEEGKKAMREFMQSDRTPQAMANMMEMARRMGGGDVMLGMTRMIEMMGRTGGGTMGGQGGMMSPGRQPGK